ncbi:UDP-2,3-diacylglucosamine diphosphatase [Alcaligenaceae bacterium]|nr:UDP-2,3-diacylglucosamine diphosphatase [Alcaligenaceae bacterium]
MNKITLPGTVWIASDIHLGPDTPATADAFHLFLDKACAQADALILCGDIFNAWIGDDLALTKPPEWLSQTLRRFTAVSEKIPLWLGHGNRDFLMGEPLARHVGARLLPDTVCLATDYGNILLSHGDEYCIADIGYQRLRRLVRNRGVQKLFLSLPLKYRLAIADWARKRSMAANRYKSANIMDVTPDAIERAFLNSGINTLVHGHTHRPATHHLTVNGQACTRIVLPDWEYDHGTSLRGGWLTIDRHGPQLHAECRSN